MFLFVFSNVPFWDALMHYFAWKKLQEKLQSPRENIIPLLFFSTVTNPNYGFCMKYSVLEKLIVS